jgi:hypothetical protein
VIFSRVRLRDYVPAQLSQMLEARGDLFSA